MRRRAMGLALIALAVPFPALALDGGGVGAEGSPGLSVSASLDSCGLAGSQIMCKIDAGWNSLEGAESYSVSVTSSNGSVVDLGETSGQGTSVWVPYAGSGTYTVNVTAYGTPPGAEEPEVIARDSSDEGEEPAELSSEPPEAPRGDLRDVDGSGPLSEEPPVPEVPVEEPVEEPEAPVCEEPPLEEPPAPAPAAPEGGSQGEAAAQAEAAQPEVVDTIPVDDDCPG
jgi:hypothetical protein